MKTINTRITQKHDLEAGWDLVANQFVPMAGEVIVYDAELLDDGSLLQLPQGRTVPYTYARIKIGDGVTPIGRLPFMGGLKYTNRAELFFDCGTAAEHIEVERLEGDGQEFYTMAPSTLTFRSTAPLNELQDIQINGETVDPSNYELEEGSTIVKLKHDYLSTLNTGTYELSVVSDSKTVKGDFTVAAPELNEYGFYYDEPYLNADQGLILFFRSNNIVRLCYYTDGWEASAEYFIENNHIVYEWEGSTFNLAIQGNTVVAEDNTIYSADVTYDKNYLYLYNADFECYEVMAKDRFKESYPDPKITINDIPVSGIAGFGFGECSNLTSIEIPKNIVNIGTSAFYGCSSLQEVILHEGITSIGESAFAYLDSLNYATYDGCAYLGSRSNPYMALMHTTESQSEYTIHQDTTVVSCYAFMNMADQDYTVVISSSVKYIGDYSFFNTPLTNVTFEEESELMSIGQYAFTCTALTSIELPNMLVNLAGNAFEYCENLEYVLIPNSLRVIETEYFFKECSNLNSIIFSGTIQEWSSIYKQPSSSGNIDIICTDGTTVYQQTPQDGFFYRLYHKGCEILGCVDPASITDEMFPTHIDGLNIIRIGSWAFSECSSLTSITIPDSITYIGELAFCKCTSLTSITIPDSVTSIGNSAFYNCLSLTSITLPDSVTRISQSTFSNCEGLTSVTIPDSVTRIGYAAFYNCTSLTKIMFEGTIAQWNNITKGTYCFRWVPATYVQCSDGQVAL